MVTRSWDLGAPGILRLPSGPVVRGRGLRAPTPLGPTPDFGVYLQGKEPAAFEWESRWIRWPDFWLPSDRSAFGNVLRDVLRRCEGERVEIACGGGYGRTGTALACLVVADGLPNDEAVSYVRQHYSRRAVETPWQKRFVEKFRV
ncbi:protein-tyrosine phosphatase family protein [Rhodococcus sovatensis]|uniref:Protein-tyrosine phosphatase family protein n=1 Tax=Rhodococcus sovatensis TaxID=1805840 RepID=A0ABZ2PEA0_9NOCA